VIDAGVAAGPSSSAAGLAGDRYVIPKVRKVDKKATGITVAATCRAREEILPSLPAPVACGTARTAN